MSYFSVKATEYYVSVSGNDLNNGLSAANPWRTMEKIHEGSNRGIFKPGDKILFKKGDSFSGTLLWSSIFGGSAPSGTKENPIYFGSYGNGAKPLFQYPADAKTEVTKRTLFSFIGVDYIIIDGFNVTDLQFPADNKQSPANCGIAFTLGSYGDVGSNHCIIRNCDMSNIGMGIVLIGNFNMVDSCRMTDLKNLKNTYSKTAPENDDDYGANGITLSGNDNIITHNLFSGNWAESYDYGFNGGAIEAFGSTSRNKIMYNTIIDCTGVMEIGSGNGGEAEDNLLANNLLINNGTLTYVNISGTFAIEASNIQYFNNTIIDLGNRSSDKALFAFNGEPKAHTIFNLQNNIFYLKSGMMVARKGIDTEKFVHENNLYYFFPGNSANYNLQNSEILSKESIFMNSSAADPLQWDLSLVQAYNSRGLGHQSAFANPLTDSNFVPSVKNKLFGMPADSKESIISYVLSNFTWYLKRIFIFLFLLLGDCRNIFFLV
ncbi:MAG TPA: hypothetical protein PLC48_11775 [Ferruginibacter sp.]|nr:hypothetical protein [Ferruginibacter sp.]